MDDIACKSEPRVGVPSNTPPLESVILQLFSATTSADVATQLEKVRAQLTGFAVAVREVEAKTESIEKGSVDMAAMMREVKRATQKTTEGVQGL